MALQPLTLENERGVPLASPSVTERLRAIDAGLTLKAYKLGDSGIQWAVLSDWPSSDQRWSRIQSGELPPSAAFDIIAWIPVDVSADQVPGYVERGLVGLDASVGYVHRMLDRIRGENRKAPAERWAKVEGKALEMFETYASKASPDVIRIASAGIPNSTPNRTPNSAPPKKKRR